MHSTVHKLAGAGSAPGTATSFRSGPTTAPSLPSLPPTCECCGHRLARVQMPMPSIPEWGLAADVFELCGGCALAALPLEVEA